VLSSLAEGLERYFGIGKAAGRTIKFSGPRGKRTLTESFGLVLRELIKQKIWNDGEKDSPYFEELPRRLLAWFIYTVNFAIDDKSAVRVYIEFTFLVSIEPEGIRTSAPNRSADPATHGGGRM
jgi:hypothetical protein